jgi:hypothetical protein
MPNGRIITLRGKGGVKGGRLKDAIYEAGLTIEEFSKLLKWGDLYGVYRYRL